MAIPEQFAERMRALLQEEYPAFERALEGARVQGLRVNLCKGGTDRLRAALPVALDPVPWCPSGFYYDDQARPGRHVLHEAGAFYIQEPSAMAAAEALAPEPGERILDLCAAPGGKSTHIASLTGDTGLLVCNEIVPDRALTLARNVERMGLKNAVVTNMSPQALRARFAGFFDRILVDAPCSGEGMFRKNQLAADEWSPDNVAMCAARQAEILDCACAMLRPGGTLVYATCTFAPEEDEQCAAALLGRHPELSLVRIPDRPGFSRGRPAWACRETAWKTPAGRGSAGRPEQELADAFPEAAEQSVGHKSASGTAPVPDGRAAQACEKTAGMPGQGQPVSGGTAGEREGCGSGAGDGACLEYAVRLFPHIAGGEGHFLAKFEKNGQKSPVSEQNMREERPGRRGEKRGCRAEDGGCRGCPEWERFRAEALVDFDCAGRYERFGERVFLVPPDMPGLEGVRAVRPGLELGSIKKARFEPAHALAMALTEAQAVQPVSLTEAQAEAYLRGETLEIAGGGKGWCLMVFCGYSLGWGKLVDGVIKNHYPKGLRRN